MRKNKLQKKILIVFIIFIVSSTTFLTIVNGKVDEKTEQLTSIEGPIYSGVTLYALGNDPAINDGIMTLEKILNQYTEISIKSINNLQNLNNDLSRNSDDYIVLFGHSNSESLSFSTEQVSWIDFAAITTKYKEKSFVLPTCFGSTIYQYDMQTIDNVIAPFNKLVDYRVGIDYTLLTLSLLFDDMDLLKYSLRRLTSHYEYIENPEYSLISVWEQDTIHETGEGRLSLYNIYNDYYNYQEFLIEASIRFCVHAAIEILLGELPIFAIVNFLVELYLDNANRQIFEDFFDYVIREHEFYYIYDMGTTTNYIMNYEYPVDPIIQRVYYYSSDSITRFEFYSHKLYETSTYYTRRIWFVDMLVLVQKLCEISFFDNFHFSLFETTLMGWRLDHTTIRTYYKSVPPPSPKPPGGGVPLPD